ncbi:2-deydro-3-deoxyphosphogluconate aldolase/4-hydroxy-2-oxoglutarate aldolase [Legionella quinlivanii]|uniref:2-dehydro-3-deoxy-phosphogluconate aldolase n=1 Tax=Legionella quinlivanii TaxID=45073 RepID=A0A0W0XZH2_9GAMM|nr:bifunctional 4-hydroxy-2-oxoglutarate aldolase/2-dehydro-3-deoxy-phosphogluconate aldolase [Legionella quinlivanii]KTD49957.1 2-deydro-3-deoxyphosphogluconate aldolase/4-hydroxy-2-oxoglutarate aldolase [Legionella quinlivanii]MCW8450552.1 bifunctional 4-hydroxy-2-oxoglutarate aldolase/2-dehydro-3-deoxy-phosphogluconate aldolase [Legionella quinlivanii]SEF96615.1 2-dehydro-3-deoxyphosphogluconate aldolase / (4S)-4-hydroxy-2-oxoglutarate aldolase [Legionella quinlivanii DSM 21216]STY11267.1 2-
MESFNWKLSAEKVFSASALIPVIVIRDLNQALPLAEALLNGGIRIMEVTLRTEIALEAIHLLSQEMKTMIIGAGTVLNALQLQQAIEAGAAFALSPGATVSLLSAGRETSIPLIPGISSVSEVMLGMEMGYRHFKFFPAGAVGGVAALKSFYGPLPDAVFCPTGGINGSNCMDYLALPNVQCVGGSWMVPETAVQNGDWQLITDLCKKANALISDKV